MSTLYRKYRPARFADVIGQTSLVTTLQNAILSDRVAQAYLFTGPRGTGKTTLARIFAKAVNCSNRQGAEPCGKCPHCKLMAENRSLDVIEIDAASHTGVDNIRELRESIALPPTLAPRKVYIIDEVHMLSQGAFNALLKTLEEPPLHALFILATTSLQKVPDTIISRCQRFDLSRFTVANIVEKLSVIAKKEKIEAAPGALELVALAAQGGMRDAESLLTQLSALSNGKITEELVADTLGAAPRQSYQALLERIVADDLPGALHAARTLTQEGRDASVFLTGLLHYLRDALYVSAAQNPAESELPGMTEEERAGLVAIAGKLSPAQCIACIEIALEGVRTAKQSVIPELPLEIALVKMHAALGHQEAKTGTSGQSQPPESPSQSESSMPEKKPAHQTAPATGTQAPPTAEPRSATQAADPEPDTPAALCDLDAIRGAWRDILACARELNASISLALSTAEPVRVEGSTLHIAVRYPFHKERLEDGANQLTLREAFDRILGIKMRVSIGLSAQEGDKASASAENPLIHQALSLLGGRVA